MLINEIYLKEAYEIHKKYNELLKLIKLEETNYINDKNKQLNKLNEYKNQIDVEFNNINNSDIIYNNFNSFLNELENIAKESETKIRNYGIEINNLMKKSEELAQKIKDKYIGIDEYDYQSQIVDYINKKLN